VPNGPFSYPQDRRASAGRCRQVGSDVSTGVFPEKVAAERSSSSVYIRAVLACDFLPSASCCESEQQSEFGADLLDITHV
jgi:hypothetical protein